MNDYKPYDSAGNKYGELKPTPPSPQPLRDIMLGYGIDVAYHASGYKPEVTAEQRLENHLGQLTRLVETREREAVAKERIAEAKLQAERWPKLEREARQDEAERILRGELTTAEERHFRELQTDTEADKND